MNLQEQLEFLELTSGDQTKIDNMSDFLDEESFVLLIDADSLLYNTVYSYTDFEYDAEAMYIDFNAQVQNIKDECINSGMDIEDERFFFTTCRNNFRKDLLPSYKANRKYNEMAATVSKLKKYVISALEDDCLSVEYSDTLEADDLVGTASREIDNGIVVAIDKDLRQLEGAHFNYKKVKQFKEDGDPKMVSWETPDGVFIMVHEKKYAGFSYTTKSEGRSLLLKQLLIGDVSDNIKGAKMVGQKKADSLIDGKSDYTSLRNTALAYTFYCIKDKEEDFWKNSTQKQYEKHKGEKYSYLDTNRLRLNIRLMKL